MLIRHQRGDTIVEVLIVLAILAMALGISYATASRSLMGARQAQEHSEALELLQGQIEQLRALAPTNTAAVYDPANYYHYSCIDAGTIKLQANINGPTDLLDSSNYDPACTNKGLGNLYSIAIYNDGNNNFTASAVWDDIRGSGTDNVSLSYRMHK